MADEHRFREGFRADARSSECLNCGTPLSGPFCAGCGQRDIPPYPSVRELAVDAVSEFSGWDGRLASTVRALVLYPGLLTHEFLEGRRARYISPLRLYLTASLVYFLVAAAAPDVKTESGKTLFLGVRVGATTTDDGPPTSRPERVSAAATSALDVDCKAHDLDNLYVVDASFFPSSSAVNPALTAMANALRVGDHLLQRMK